MEFATDLTHYDSLALTFDVAYQTLQGYSDSLEVTISTDCGMTFQRIYNKGGNTLATAPHLDSPSAVFLPTASQWRTEHVNLAAYSHQSGVVFSFNNVSGYGTYLYVDNINLQGVISVNTGIPNSEEMAHISIYPNPSKGLLTIQWQDILKDNINLTIYDLLGAKVKELTITTGNQTRGQASIDISNLPDGIYYVKADKQISKLTLIK